VKLADFGVAQVLDEALRLLAYRREERYPTAELAARALMDCRDLPRDGRGALVRLLVERFPRARRRDPLVRPPELVPPSDDPSTLTAPAGAPMDAPP
jgi:hypothetical protein